MKKKIVFAIELFLVSSVLIAVTVFAAQVGSSEDPLVAKSYVDDKIEQVLKLINGSTSSSNSSNSSGSSSSSETSSFTEEDKKAIVNEIMEQIEPLIAISVNDLPISTGGDSSKYTPVFAKVGQVVYGSEGTELILRSGKGNILIDGVAGIVDATSGIELNNGAKVPSNHILLIPRADGRGIKMTEDGWFMIKGEYEIK